MFRGCATLGFFQQPTLTDLSLVLLGVAISQLTVTWAVLTLLILFLCFSAYCNSPAHSTWSVAHQAAAMLNLRQYLPKSIGRYALGIFFLLCVVFIWVSSSFLMSFMFKEREYNKPVFITYINTATFTLYLAGTLFRLVRPQRPKNQAAAPEGSPSTASSRKNSLVGMDRSTSMITGPDGHVPTTSALGFDAPVSIPDAPPPSYKQSLESTGNSFDVERALISSGKSSLDLEEVDPDVANETVAQPVDKLSMKETAKLSLTFCLLWFAANGCSNASLSYTSVSNSTILCSTSGLFTLILGVLVRVERLTVLRVASVVASIGGVYLVTTSVTQSAEEGPRGHTRLVGDILAIVSAFFYGCYTILIKLKIDNEDRVHMPTFLGFVGLFNLVLLWPIFFVLHYTNVEPFELPVGLDMWGMILLNALIGTFLSDYLWLLAVLMTSPLVVTLGIALTNPLAMLGDLMFKGMEMTPWYWVGAALVMIGFLASNK
ncbi:hypothetical protein H4R33_002257 [Dimargaris cristalligena]|nr:hypothetical protein H4R33_002257 [Dimargaris cristalligena]